MNMNVLTGLLSKGYFPKELPPVFTTAHFGSHAAEIIESWRSDEVFSTKAADKIKTQDGKRVPRRGSYEAIRKGWLQDVDGVMSDPFFAAMANKGVEFYDPQRNIPRSQRMKKKAFALRKQQQEEVMLFLQTAREADWMFPEYSEY